MQDPGFKKYRAYIFEILSRDFPLNRGWIAMKDCPDNSVIRTISHSPVLVSALLACALTYVAGLFVWSGQFIFGLPFGPSSGALPEIVKYDLLTRLFVGSLAAPIVETFLFQWLPIRLIRRTFGGNVWSAICASTLAFGATHGYSILYVAVALWGGLIFATVFVLRDYPGGRPFLVVATAHAARNTLASILV